MISTTYDTPFLLPEWEGQQKEDTTSFDKNKGTFREAAERPFVFYTAFR